MPDEFLARVGRGVKRALRGAKAEHADPAPNYCTGEHGAGVCGGVAGDDGSLPSYYSLPAQTVAQADALVGAVAGHGPPGSGTVGWVGQVSVQPTDASAAFHAALARIEVDNTHTLQTRWDVAFLFVPGLLCSRYPLYMRDTRHHFQNVLGLDARMLEVNTEASVATNAATIADRVEATHRATRKRVVLVGHSKGGCDVVAAMGRYAARLVPIVAGVVTLQAPLGGTPLAEDVARHTSVKKAFDLLVGAMGGTGECLDGMRYDQRRTELAEYPFPPAVPVVSFASSISGRGASRASPMRPLQRYIAAHHNDVPNDGMVAAPDAHLPGSLRVQFAREFDHGGCAFPNPPWGAAHGRHVNEALVEMLMAAVPHACLPSLTAPEPQLL
eukprot:TRINITY_DN13978_c0_g1_i1.p1 TRINITY_DN13978_c0_g1~~TRINITY_DN13978_c0_g1_i1.p1  ORF type:complete len:385 (+),score=67.08 TRINITY_DN13978_c0_g1_i1:93-1247(+)